VEELKKGPRARRDGSGRLTFSAAYIRVSSASQDYASQRHAIEQAAGGRGERVELWFEDVASGGTMRRPQLASLRRQIELGNCHKLWVWRLDRITRSGIVDMLSVVRGIQADGCELVTVAEAFPLEGKTSDVILAIIAYCAELQRTQIRENQDAARTRMEMQGRSWGRPPLPRYLRDSVRELRSQKKTQRQIAKELQISKTSVDRILHETEHEAAAEIEPF
jgi:DNA invertase Pin-like site-specific DNA recombinase